MKKVVVTTKQGDSIRGTRTFHLWRVVLHDAEILEHGAKLEGRVEIPRSNVAMVQVL